DGIRYATVTGVQTCALPILDGAPRGQEWGAPAHLDAVGVGREVGVQGPAFHARTAQVHARVVYEIRFVNDDERLSVPRLQREGRSEERRVGKQSRHRGWGCM